MLAHTALLIALAVPAARADQKASAGLDTVRIEQLTGARGALNAKEGVFRISVPRDDLDVYARGVRLSPGLGLTAWAAFKKVGNGTMVVGDMVLLEDQVDPAVAAALGNGLEVHSVQSRFIGESPRLVYLRVTGAGEEAALAASIGKVLGVVRTKSANAMPALAEVELAARTTIDPKKVEAAMGMKGVLADGVYRVSRGHSVKAQGQTLGAAMGAESWAGFTAVDDQVAVAGELLVPESALQPLLKTLRGGGLTITSVQRRFVGDEPRMLFVNFWGVGPLEKLARPVKAAFEQTAR